MAQHKPRSRIAQFKQPFLVGAVTSAALLSGCGGETEGTSAQPNGVTGDPTSPIEPTVPEPGVTSNPPGLFDPRCPQPLPESGDSCSAAIEGKVCSDSDSGPGLICTQGKWQGNGALSSLCPKVVPTADQSCAAYQPDLDCEYVTGCEMNFRCVDGLWQDHSPSCNPPPPETIGECPTEVPTAGDDCTAYEPSLNCEYDGSICPQEFKCEAGTWENNSLICNPPEVLGDCPEERPVVGDGCEEYLVGIECTYDATDSSCPEASSVTCGSLGVWEGPEVICNPPPPELSTECPVELPTPGTSCEDHQVGLHCGEASCDGGIGATCGSNGLWEAFVLACNPPMPEVSESPDGGPLFDAGAGSDAPSGG